MEREKGIIQWNAGNRNFDFGQLLGSTQELGQPLR